MKPFYQVAFTVHRIEDAMDELSRAVGVRWYEPFLSETLKVAISIDGPPHIELIEATAGSPWDATRTGPRFDHLHWWSEDLEADTERLEREGIPLTDSLGDAQRGLRYYHAKHTGLRIELAGGDPTRPNAEPLDYLSERWSLSGEWAGPSRAAS